MNARPPRTAAVLSTVRPFPVDNGKSVVIAGFLGHLADRLGPENVHYLHVGEPLAATSDFGGIRVHEMGQPDRADQLRSLVVDVGMRGRSFQEALTSSALIAERVRIALSCLAPDLEIIDTVRMVQYVRGWPSMGRRVIYLDDLFSVRYQRMLDVLDGGNADFDPLGQFGSFVPRQLQFLARQRVSRKLLLGKEMRRVARAEHNAARSSDLCVLLNDLEARALAAATGTHVEVVPPLVPQQAAPEQPASTGRPDFAFVGLLSIPHNHDALTWFIRECLPRVRRQLPHARLHVIGRGASSELRACLAEHADSVVQHGFVPDLDRTLRSMTGVINTLRFGSGVKIKALEALSRGLPVVATSVGAEGIVTHTRPGLVIANDPDEIAAALVRLSDASQRALASTDALNLYARQFSKGAVERSYDRVFGTCADPTMAPSMVEMNVSGLK